MALRVFLSSVRPGDRYISTTGQVFVIMAVNSHIKSLEALAMTGMVGPGSVKSQKAGEVRTILNGHQWCTRMRPYKAKPGEVDLGAQEAETIRKAQ